MVQPPVVADARQKHRAAATSRLAELTQRFGADFQTDGDIQTDRARTAQPACAIDVSGNGLRGGGALCGAYSSRRRERRRCRSASRSDIACGIARLQAGTSDKGRHPQLPVRTVALDLSNKWDHLRQVRLSAARQTCTMLSARLSIPWVFQLGSRGNPVHLSNTAGDACRSLYTKAQGCCRRTQPTVRRTYGLKLQLLSFLK
jgi:hypothetical protein